MVRADNLKKLRLQDFRTLLTGYYLGWRLNQSTRTTGFLPCKPLLTFLSCLGISQVRRTLWTLLLDFRTVETYNSFICALCVVIRGHCYWERTEKKVFLFCFVFSSQGLSL